MRTRKRIKIYALIIVVSYHALLYLLHRFIPNSIITYIIGFPIVLELVVIQDFPDWIQYFIHIIVSIMCWVLVKFILLKVAQPIETITKNIDNNS